MVKFKNLARLINIRSYILISLLLQNCNALATCTMTDTTTTGFGNSYGSADFNSREIASITVNCDSEYRISLNAGLNSSVNRRLHDSGHYISYYLWTDTAATTEWGDNSITYPANALTATGSHTNSRHPIYGSAMGTNYAGYYNDILHITVAYPPYGTMLETDLILNLTITGTCTMDSSGMTGFGAWPQDAANLTNVALGVLTVNCTAGMNYRLGINKGLNWNAGKRQMANDGNYVPYLLWTNASGTTEWGDTGLAAIEGTYIETHPASAQFGTGTGNPQNFFIWGDALIENAEIAGIYSDTVLMTIVWP